MHFACVRACVHACVRACVLYIVENVSICLYASLMHTCAHMRRYPPCARAGTLTWLGAAAHQANGLWLRQRYIEEHALLSSDLKDDSELAVRSTPFPRCAQSAQNLLLGLYPPSTRGGDAANPVQTPVATTTRGFESMYGVWFSNAESCPRMIQVLHEVYRAQHQWMSDDDKALEARVTAEIGMNPNGVRFLSTTFIFYIFPLPFPISRFCSF